MTTTPAPSDIDLDTLKTLLDAMPEGPWRVAQSLPNPGIRTAAGWEVVHASYADSGPRVLEFIAAARNALPALLDDPAKTRADVEKLTTALDIVALREIRQAAALAKTRTYLAVEEQSHGETIDDRDACHEAADKLAGAIAAAVGVDIGEHSNMNDPWANALDAMPKLVAELATYKAEVKHADAEREEAERNRDTTRAELAKTHRDRDEIQRALIQTAGWQAEAERNRDHWKERYDEQLAATRQLDDMRMREIGELNRELAKTRAELDERAQTFKTLWREFELNSKRMEELTEAQGRLMQWAAAELGTSLIHKRIRQVLGLDASVEAMAAAQAAPNDVNASGERLCVANPATTAEPADEPKATCSCKWSPVQGRIWCDPCAAARDSVLEAAAKPDAEPAAG